MRVALLADIHGNLPALLAVQAELERIQPDAVVVNGDLINAVPFSGEVVDLVRAQPWCVVRGNHEYYYLDFGTPRAAQGTDDPARWGQLHWLVERITPAQSIYLAMLPDDCTLYFPGTQPLRVTHGVPGRNRIGFYHEQSTVAMVAELDAVDEPTLISAHTHVQVDRLVSNYGDPNDEMFADPHLARRAKAHSPRHWHVVNPGSVGLPLNSDPTAQFALIESVPVAEVPGGWRATHYRIDYDRRPALAAFAESGMAAAGGAITELYYWELVTAQPEIVLFYRWARAHGYDAEADITTAFTAYCAGTNRPAEVRAQDPLYQQVT
jgi:predicted phosphodiesterase